MKILKWNEKRAGLSKEERIDDLWNYANELAYEYMTAKEEINTEDTEEAYEEVAMELQRLGLDIPTIDGD